MLFKLKLLNQALLAHLATSQLKKKDSSLQPNSGDPSRLGGWTKSGFKPNVKNYSPARGVNDYSGRGTPKSTANPYPHGIAPDHQFPPF